MPARRFVSWRSASTNSFAISFEPWRSKSRESAAGQRRFLSRSRGGRQPTLRSRRAAALSRPWYAFVRARRNCFAYHFAQSRDLNIGCNLERRSTPRRLRLHYSASLDASRAGRAQRAAPLRFHRLVSLEPFIRHARLLSAVSPTSMNLIFIPRTTPPVSRSSPPFFPLAERIRRRGKGKAGRGNLHRSPASSRSAPQHSP